MQVRWMSDDEVRGAAYREEAGLGTLSTAKGNLPLTEVEVRASIMGLLSSTKLSQTFQNSFAEPIEATYIFPIPERGAVKQFTLTLPDKIIKGEVKERGQAREEYDQAISRGQQAAIAEEERPGLFTLRVGNLPPRSWAKVELVIVSPLQLEEGEATFRFPLVVAPRYIPGAPLSGEQAGDGTAPDTDAVPDASRISPPVLLPGFPNPVRLSFEVSLNPAGLSVRDLGVSLHDMQLSEKDGVYLLRLHPGERLDRDVIIRYRFDASELTSTLFFSETEEQGSFLLTLVPPRREKEQAARDVIFVLDRSGSMQGWKMIAARRAVARMIDTLHAKDRFSLMLFDDRIETPPGAEGLVSASDRARYHATEFLAKAEARGGTEMAAPLQKAAELLSWSESGRTKFIVLITDGQVGNEDQLLRMLSSKLQGARIFALGIDRAVNASFLQRLASLGDGKCELVESEERLDEVMTRLHRALSSPVLTNLSLSGDGLTLHQDSLTPKRLPDVFEGTPAQIFGRYQGKGRLVVKGLLTGGAPFTAKLEGLALPEGDAIDTLWARSILRELEERYVIGAGSHEALEKQMIEISTRAQVVCRFTALLAVDHERIVNEGGKQRKVMQAVEQPSGWKSKEKKEANVLFSLSELTRIETARVKAEEESMPITASRRALARAPVAQARPQVTTTQSLRRNAPDSGHLTKTGAIIGTPRYMSPEKAMGRPTSLRSDIFVLGVMLYEALTGKSLYSGSSFMEVLSKIISNPLPADLHQNPALAPFVSILERCLDKDEQKRFASFSELREALQDVQKSASLNPQTLQEFFAQSLSTKRDSLEQMLRQPGQPIEQLGPYLLVSKLDEGHSGVYYLAQNTKTQAWVYLREAHPYVDEHTQKQLISELVFSHPGVVKVLEAFSVDQSRLFVAFEFVHGLTLEQVIKEKGALPSGVVCEIFIWLAEVLEAAQKASFSHQDLNPEHTILGFDGAVKLREWGAATHPSMLPPMSHYTSSAPTSPLVVPPLPVNEKSTSLAAPPTLPDAPLQASPKEEPAPNKKQWWKFWK